MQRCPDSHGHLTKWLVTATYWRLGLCPQNFTSTGHWISSPFWFYCKTTSLWVTTAPIPDKRKYFQKLSNVFKFQKQRKLICIQNQCIEYPSFFLEIILKNDCLAVILVPSQLDRYKLCTHKMAINLVGFLFTHKVSNSSTRKIKENHQWYHKLFLSSSLTI